SVVLALDVAEEELVQRILNRGLTSGRADDVNEFVIRERIIEYNKKTMSVADHYRKQDKVVMIKGEGSVDSIFEELCAAINERMQQAEK
ncbi:MAG: adenylate kinase, partial [Bacteroidota bacterium]|nr:adenylate kinase [Bacteroidota bacterium]